MRHFTLAALLIGTLFTSTASAQGDPPAHGAMQPGPGNSPGWALMTPQERAEHRARLSGFTNVEDCTAYLAEHHALMLERARAKGVTLPATPRQDFCRQLPHKAGSN